MSATPGIRIVNDPKWWTPKLNLSQDLFKSAELVQIKNYLWDPNTQPEEFEYYKKYEVLLTDGRRYVLPNRVSDVSGVKWDIQKLLDWQAREVAHRILGMPVLTVKINGAEPYKVKGDWIKIDAELRRLEKAKKEAHEQGETFGYATVLDLEYASALVQPHEEYFWPALMQKHRQAYFDRSKTRDEAAELGTRAHDLIDKWLTHQDLQDFDEEREVYLFDRVIYKDRDGKTWQVDLKKEDPRVQAACAAFHTFWIKEGLEMRYSELLVVDLKNGTAGMIDNVSRVWVDALNDWVYAILDYKTGNYIATSMLLQTSGYAAMFELMTGTRIEKVWIIQLDKETAEYRLVTVFDTQEEGGEEKRRLQLGAWDRAMELYHWQKGEQKTTLKKPEAPKKKAPAKRRGSKKAS